MSSGWHAKYGPWMNELTVACEVGGCQTDAGEGCATWRRVCCRATQLSTVSDRATRLVGLAEPGARIRFDNRVELLRMSSVGVTPVDVFSTVFMIHCTMGNCS